MARRKQKELVSQREYARRRGISHTAVRKAIRSGRIVPTKGKLNPAKADRQWRDNTDPTKPNNLITGKPRDARKRRGPPQPRHLEESDDSSGGNGTAAGYAKARAARELYQAQMAKLELDERRGELVRADDVKLGVFQMARKARDQLMGLPDRMAAIMAATTDAAEAHRLLEEEVERICREISDEWP